jgi:hypothetical protein
MKSGATSRSPLLFRGALAAAVLAFKCLAADNPKLLSLRLAPNEVTLWGPQSAQRFLVLGKYSDGLERDVTASARFTPASADLLHIDSTGRVTPLADGQAVLKAELDGQSAESKIVVQEFKTERQPSFARDIASILTMQGCNASKCHGAVAGKGGFKLSLYGSYLRDDYQWIVNGGTYHVLTDKESGPKTPRIDRKEPEKSLLLLKPTDLVDHEGGERFTVDSPEYRTVLAWIRNGAPYGNEGETAEITRVEVFPSEAVLDRSGKHQLLVTAIYSNGRREDITDKVLYSSNNPDVLKVSKGGLVTAVAPGETAVLVRAPGQNVSARIGVISEPIPNYPDIPRHNFIDDFIFTKLRKFQILPSELAADDEFLRRVCLDLTGTLPPPARVREFLADTDPAKRVRLLDRLLDSPEYVDYWTWRFADLFRVAVHANGNYPKYSQFYWEWLRNAIAQNKPYDQVARERIAAQGYGGAATHYLPILQPPLPEDAVAEEARVFLGRRLDCAQCHNHPFENWSQDQFWGLAAFFGQLSYYWFADPGTEAIVLDDPDGYSRRGNAKILHPRTKKEVVPAFFDGQELPKEKRSDPRLALADWMISKPEFAETAVNRMWSFFFGRGIVDPVDDFRSTNPATHPELLKALAEDFRKNHFDLKHLMRQIVMSRTYQLSTTPNSSNKDDRNNYSRMLPRPLDGEVLLDAISQVTQVPEVFPTGMGGQAPTGTRAIQLKESDMYPSRFLEVHGRPRRQMVPQRDNNPNLLQALHRVAGRTYTEKISSDGGRIDRLLKSEASDEKIIEEFYLAAFTRFPTAQESGPLKIALAEAAKKNSRELAVEDFVWALLSAQEFTHR